MAPNMAVLPCLGGILSITKTPESTRGSIGQGLYSLGDLQRYLAFDGDEKAGELASYWLTRVLNVSGHRKRRSDYSFTDLVSLFVVRELRRKGVKPARIRAAEQHLRKALGVDRPFACEEISTDGQRVYGPGGDVADGMPDQVEEASHGGQHALHKPISHLLQTIRYDDGAAAAWEPMRGIVLNPEIQFGDPVIEGTRIPTFIAAEGADVLGLPGAADRLGLDRAAVQRAVAFERRLAALRN